MIKKIYFYIAIMFILNQCGFTPIYSEKSNVIESNYITILTSNNSLAVKEAFKAIFRDSTDQPNYQLRIDIIEQDLPIVTNSDGTIAKYRIDITTNFILFDIANNKEIFSDYSKGFAQYETQTNNYDTEQKRNEAKKIATSNSLQLIPIKIQNFQSRKDK
ncbi:MAG: hypothetical protein P8M06_02315 [Pelagibacterales bacterium]|nr:hypothetical protein [Pelagibacterales bacterium]